MRVSRARLTVRGLLLAVAVLAFDFAVIRKASEKDINDPCSLDQTYPALAFVPSVSLLGVAAVHSGLLLWRRGETPPFATGYLLGGGLSTLGVSLAFAMMEPIDFVSALLKSVLVASPLSDFRDELLLAAMILAQFVAGLIAGALAVRHGLGIVLSKHARRNATHLSDQGRV
jgi:hypothetical protein